MIIIKANPVWIGRIPCGDCGFITREGDVTGDGIEYFEHYDSGIPFVHTFVVSGPNQVIEAHARLGVHRGTLNQYLGQANCQCFIRVPAGWTPDIGARIVAAAAAHLGEKYGYGLILADALANTFLGHCLNAVTLDAPDKIICRLLNNRHKQICSELVALALKQLPYLRVRGCLRFPADTIMPKLLGNDPRIWEPEVYRIS